MWLGDIMEREITSIRQNIQEVVKQTPDVAGALLPAVNKIHQASQETKIGNSLTQAQLEINGITNQYRIDNEADPMANIKDYNTQVQDVFKKHGKGIGALYKGQWANKANALISQTKVNTDVWSIGQNTKNAVNNLNEAMEGQFQLSYIDGQNFATGDESDFASLLKFEQSRDELQKTTSKFLGTETTKGIMENYEKDYMKSFISGAIESDPELGVKLLEDERTNILDSEEKKELEKTAQVRTKELVLDSLKVETGNESSLMDTVNNPEATIYDKKVAIDKMFINGLVSDSFTKKYKKILDSTQAVDGNTVDGVMADILLRTNDLNAIADLNQEDYLIGVRNIREEIMTAQATGKLSPDDAKKLNRQITTLTTTKLSGATSNIAWNFTVASDMFDEQLPPEFRGTAVRKLFYETGTQELTQEQYGERATKIIDNINFKRREDTIKRVDEIKNKQANEILDKGEIVTRHFDSVDAVNKANLPSGTVVIINGRKATVD